MGQKINPLGFRLGTTQSHHSFWFAKPKDFPAELQEDERIRDSIKNYVQKNLMKVSSDFEGIIRIEIHKYKELNTTQVKIDFGRQNLLTREEEEEKDDKEEKKKLELLKTKAKIIIQLIPEPYEEPHILAEYIALQLKNRIPLGKAMQKVIELMEETDIKGIRIQIAGCIGGKERAHVQWIREGRLPLQTIRAKIKYCSYKVQTPHGVLGIKIWMFVDFVDEEFVDFVDEEFVDEEFVDEE
uniref:ribosomal protein S3 n=1 Tax=Vallisneria natans TaxID=62345 RepID=UPI0022FD55E9|nr:ribosomal protein S3 [Vallisneria natans]WAO28696.1 ribosomal protein S3 [Vallisneria natans]